MVEVLSTRGWMSSVRRLLSGRRAVAMGLPAAEPSADSPAQPAAPDRRIDLLLAEWQEIQGVVRRANAERLARLGMFLVGYAAIAGFYLAIVQRASGPFTVARWALPALGLVLGGEFLALEAGARNVLRVFERRGLTVEAALNSLVPGIGRIQALALVADGAMEARDSTGSRAVILFYVVLTLGWIAALVATAAGSVPAALAP